MNSDPDAQRSCRVQVRGRVQGVGYRSACMQQAQALGLRGWVRNRADGSVEAVLRGSPRQVEAMCDWMRHRVPGALVVDMAVTELPPGSEGTAGFELRPT